MKSRSQFTFLPFVAAGMLLAACAAESTSTEAPTPAAPVGSPPAPTAAPVLTSKGQQGSTQVLPNDPDAGDSHTYHLAADGAHGKVYVSAKGMVVYIPDATYAGGDRFQILVADSQGVTATTWVAAAVRFAPADPTAAADIVTYKNTPAAYVVFAPSGVPSGFSIAAAPGNGSAEIDAQGILTYTPDEGFAGADSIGVNVTLMAGDATEVTLRVNVINRAPAPTAAAIQTETNRAATVQVQSGDPDVRDSATYAIAVPPANGAASIDATGRLTYTPAIAMGVDRLYVRVTDGSGAAATAPVNVRVRLPELAGAFPAEVCNDGLDRVLVADIDPAHGEVVKETTVVTATLLYSLATTTEIGIRIQSSNATVTSTTVAPGCGAVTVSGTMTPLTGGLVLAPFPGGNQYFHYPQFAMSFLQNPGYWTEPLGGPVIDYVVSFEARHSSILSQLDFDIGFGDAVRADFPTESVATVHVRTPNACGLRYRELEFTTSGVGSLSQGVFAAPNLPPAVEVGMLLTDIPVTPGKTYTLALPLGTCGAPVDVTLTASAPWFSVSNTTVTLNTINSVTFEIDADLMPAGDTLVEGTLLLHPVDGSFADIEIPVSAIRFDAVDLAGFTPIALGAAVDDGNAAVDLPWPFPFEGVTHTTGVFTTEGPICLLPSGGDCTDFIPIYGGIHTYAPGIIGGPLLAPFWTGLQGNHIVGGENTSGIYWREVTDGADPHVQFLWWDIQTRFVPASAHNVFSLLLFPDGRFVYEYPSIQPNGIEVATWWYLFGNAGFDMLGADLKSGDRFEFGPIE